MPCYLKCYRNTSQERCIVIWTVTATRHRKEFLLSELLPQHVTEKMSCYLNCYRDIFRHPRRTSLNALFKLFKDMFCKPATSQILWYDSFSQSTYIHVHRYIQHGTTWSHLFSITLHSNLMLYQYFHKTCITQDRRPLWRHTSTTCRNTIVTSLEIR